MENETMLSQSTVDQKPEILMFAFVDENYHLNLCKSHRRRRCCGCHCGVPRRKSLGCWTPRRPRQSSGPRRPSGRGRSSSGCSSDRSKTFAPTAPSPDRCPTPRWSWQSRWRPSDSSATSPHLRRASRRLTIPPANDNKDFFSVAFRVNMMRCIQYPPHSNSGVRQRGGPQHQNQSR